VSEFILLVSAISPKSDLAILYRQAKVFISPKFNPDALALVSAIIKRVISDA
jgi:hypothetical protein